ncbi:MAG: extracellular solute-binding protein [Treponema sp.]|jgi:putative aldouronate transport system substrate-binding protein|nr:extracellular solute-binding protein [Treponema sp.]
MRKLFAVLMIAAVAFSAFAGGRQSSSGGSGGGTAGSGTTAAPAGSSTLNQLGLEQVNGIYRFRQTQTITVEVFDRGLDGGRSKPEDNFYTKWIQAGMLRDHNVQVIFKPVPRWTEVDELNNMLAAGTAPDICVTYNYATIQSYANMGGVTDLNPYVNRYQEFFPSLWEWLGDECINYNLDPVTGNLWGIMAKMSNPTRINTFIREDWLKKLNIPVPTTLDAFYKALVAFRDNAGTLLGANARMMIPFSHSFDVGWRAEHLLQSFIPGNINDRDFFVYSIDDYNLARPSSVAGETAAKSAARVLNRWYNENLTWKDFALYGEGDTTEDNLLKSGYIGAFIHNWDYPWRNGNDSILAAMKKLAGSDADYIAITPFKDDAGMAQKYGYTLTGVNLFFPASNKNPIAGLLYLDWITKQENLGFLQFGEEGVTHTTTSSGAVQTITAAGDKIQNSPNNVDYTLTINGIKMPTLDLTIKSMALAYTGIDSSYIEAGYYASAEPRRIMGRPIVGEIASESGMAQIIKDKRNALFAQSITASAANFDAVWNAGYRDLMNSGGQAIIDERIAKWKQFYGDKTSVR